VSRHFIVQFTLKHLKHNILYKVFLIAYSSNLNNINKELEMDTTRRSVLTVTSLALLWSVGAQAQHAHSSSTLPSLQVAQTAMAQRDLWIGHVFWVRNVVSETLAGNSAAVKAAENAVVANAKQIAASIEPFYGKAATEKLFELLAGHYGAIKEYLNAGNNAGTQEAAMKNLTSNASDIAVFLSDANPYLPVDTLRGLLLAHGGHHVQQIRQLRAKQYTQEVQTREEMKNHMHVISDALAGALAKQFPEKFK
jgi:gas vesicle protein